MFYNSARQLRSMAKAYTVYNSIILSLYAGKNPQHYDTMFYVCSNYFKLNLGTHYFFLVRFTLSFPHQISCQWSHIPNKFVMCTLLDILGKQSAVYSL